MNKLPKKETKIQIKMNVQDLEWLILAVNSYYLDDPDYDKLQDDLTNIRQSVSTKWSELQAKKNVSVSEDEYVKSHHPLSSNEELKGENNE